MRGKKRGGKAPPLKNYLGKEMSECPFCKVPIDKLTEWYFWDVENQIIVCKDLHPREYKYRILAVGYGESWHKHWEDYSKKEKDYIMKLLIGVAETHVANGAKLANIDTEHFLIENHGHAQACMK